jgi:sugar/nucleoside kinase (ribokinase family)
MPLILSYARRAVNRRDVIAVGDVMIDVAVEADALAQGGHVSGKVRITPGGSAANAAAWARAGAASAAVVGRVGQDVAGKVLRSALEDRGIDALCAVDESSPTGVVLTLGSTIVAERGANARLAVNDVPAPLAARAVLVSGYALLQGDTEPAALAALERADADWIAVDAASARLLDRYGRERFFAATSAGTALLLNEDEAFVLTDEEPEGAARALGDLYRLVCVKRGADGAVGVLEGELLALPAPEIAVVDPAGAGDAFAGALLAALVRERRFEDALAEAVRAGSAAAASPTSWPEPS